MLERKQPTQYGVDFHYSSTSAIAKAFDRAFAYHADF